jgi:hypothetical protein
MDGKVEKVASFELKLLHYYRDLEITCERTKGYKTALRHVRDINVK